MIRKWFQQVANISGLSALMISRAVSPVAVLHDVDLSSTLRGGAAAGISMADTGSGGGSSGDTGSDSGDDQRNRRKNKEESDTLFGLSASAAEMYLRLLNDQSKQADMLKMTHELFVRFKKQIENVGLGNVAVLIAYDRKENRYRLTMRLEAKEKEEMNLSAWRLFETRLWFNSEGDIEIEKHNNRSVDLGEWDKIRHLGRNDKTYYCGATIPTPYYFVRAGFVPTPYLRVSKAVENAYDWMMKGLSEGAFDPRLGQIIHHSMQYQRQASQKIAQAIKRGTLSHLDLT